MKHLVHILALTFSMGISQTASAETVQTGMREITIKDGNTLRPLDGILWYPATGDAQMTTQHRNGVWAGVEVAKNGASLAGTYPLAVLSHGMYGNARNQNWLAVALVKAGYIAITLNHPGTSTWLRETDDARQIWERPKDISRAISYLLGGGAQNLKVDPNRIYMAGHSLGGMTAVQLAGGIYAPEQNDAICAAEPDDLICGLIEKWQFGKTPEDRISIAQDLSDPRIKAIATLDLGATQTFSAQSLGAIKTPMLVIGAPIENQGSLDLDRESRALVSALPQKSVRYMEPESLAHMDFLGTCTEGAIAILEEESPGDGFVCFDGTTERIKDHALIATALIDFFAKH